MNACMRICAVQPFLCGNTLRSSSVQNSVYSYFAVDLRLNREYKSVQTAHVMYIFDFVLCTHCRNLYMEIMWYNIND